MTNSKWLQLDERAQNILIKMIEAVLPFRQRAFTPINGTGIALLPAGVSQLLTLSAHGKN